MNNDEFCSSFIHASDVRAGAYPIRRREAEWRLRTRWQMTTLDAGRAKHRTWRFVVDVEQRR
jgi:hypothetical protein